MKDLKYKCKQLNDTRVLKVRNSPLELEKDFNLIDKSITDMGKFKKKKTNKEKTFTKNMWHDQHDWLINYIPRPTKEPWLVFELSPNYVFLKPRIILNQNVSKLRMEMERNQIH